MASCCKPSIFPNRQIVRSVWIQWGSLLQQVNLPPSMPLYAVYVGAVVCKSSRSAEPMTSIRLRHCISWKACNLLSLLKVAASQESCDRTGKARRFCLSSTRMGIPTSNQRMVFLHCVTGLRRGMSPCVPVCSCHLVRLQSRKHQTSITILTQIMLIAYV